MLGWWLAERQLPNGGLNGRPEKLEDVRYIVTPKRMMLLTRTTGLLFVLGPLIPLDNP